MVALATFGDFNGSKALQVVAGSQRVGNTPHSYDGDLLDNCGWKKRAAGGMIEIYFG